MPVRVKNKTYRFGDGEHDAPRPHAILIPAGLAPCAVYSVDELVAVANMYTSHGVEVAIYDYTDIAPASPGVKFREEPDQSEPPLPNLENY